MKRSDFLKTIAMGSLTIPFTKLSDLRRLREISPDTERMPMLFIGHGNPMNAIEDNAFRRSWNKLGKTLPKPKAILTISAHWITRNSTKVTAMKAPKTIHDFGGFPQELFDQQYPAPGSAELAQDVIKMVQKTHVEEDHQWGLDHGTWSVLKPMFPDADIPVIQLSLDYGKPMEYHFQIGQEIKKLREKGVLVIGSGNIVHNLRKMNMSGVTSDWALEFDQFVANNLIDRNFKAITDFQNLGSLAQIAHPSYDHFLPLIYNLGSIYNDDEIKFFNDSFDLGTISMRSVLVSKQI